MYSQYCLVCLSPGVEPPSSPSPPEEDPLRKELDVIFLLRTLLELPPSQLHNYLELSGGQNPSEWGLTLCTRCENAVEALRTTYRQILELKARFQKGRSKLLDILRGSAVGEVDDLSYFVEETRKHILEGGTELKESPAVSLIEPAPAPRTPTPSSSSAPRHKHLPQPPLVIPPPSVPGANYQCSLCSETFITSGKLKEHAIIRHPEKFFPPSSFLLPNTPAVPLETFKSLCTRVFQEEQLQSLGNNCYSCSLCSSTYFSRPPVWVHLAESHHTDMAAKLKRLLYPNLVAEVRKRVQQPEFVAPRKSLLSAQCFELPMSQLQRKRRSNAKHPSIIPCRDCGMKFGTASSVSRHRAIYCPVRRSLGLLKGTRRAYNRRSRGTASRGNRANSSRYYRQGHVGSPQEYSSSSSFINGLLNDSEETYEEEDEPTQFMDENDEAEEEEDTHSGGMPPARVKEEAEDPLGF